MRRAIPGWRRLRYRFAAYLLCLITVDILFASSDFDPWQCIIVDSAVTIWPGYVINTGRFFSSSDAQIVIRGGDKVTVSDIQDGVACEKDQFTITEKIRAIVVCNTDSDPYDEALIAQLAGFKSNLYLYNHGETQKLIKLEIGETDSAGSIDLKYAILTDGEEKFLIGAVRTYIPSKGPRLLFGVSLGEEPRVEWVKRIPESYEKAVSLPTPNGQVAVFGGHATLNRLVYDGQVHRDDTSYLIAVDRQGNEIARIGYKIPHPQKPSEPGYMHTLPVLPYSPSPEYPYIIALHSSVQYKEVDGIICCYLLDVENGKWIEVEKKELRVDYLLHTLQPDDDGIWQFCTQCIDSMRLAILKFHPERHHWTVHPLGCELFGYPMQFLYKSSNLHSFGKTAFFYSKLGDELNIEALNYDDDRISHSLAATISGGVCGIIPLSASPEGCLEFIAAISEPVSFTSSFDYSYLGTKIARLYRIIPSEKSRSGNMGKNIINLISLLSLIFIFINGGLTHRALNRIPHPVKETGETEKESKWTISPESAERVRQKLRQCMEIEEIFMNEDIISDEGRFTLDFLTEHINEKKHHISQIIARDYENFSDFVNKYRIEKVKRRLKEEKYSAYTIEAVASDAGYKSMSTFYEAFKKYTGMTPKQFRDKS